MASSALNPAYRLATVAEFLAMDLGDVKAELVDGSIQMMAGGSRRHAAIAANLLGALLARMSGTGCRPFGSDLAVRTSEASSRFPDVSVYCREDLTAEKKDEKLIGDPRVVFEVLSPSTASNDQIIKLAEYRALPGVQGLIFVDPDNECVRIVVPSAECDADWLQTGSDLDLPMLGSTLPHAEIFADL